MSDKTDKPSGTLHSDDGQGDDENRTEAYEEYDEGESQSETQPGTENSRGVAGSAGKQSAMVQSPGDDIEGAILYAKKYLEDLLSFFGLNTDIYATTEDQEVIELDVPSTHLNGFLIGQHGDTMRSLQQIISSALKNQNYSHTRVNVDIAGYKKQRADRLAKQAEDWFREVQKTGQPKELSPMNAADRRIIHKTAADYGLVTESVGFGRDRHVILRPEDSASA